MKTVKSDIKKKERNQTRQDNNYYAKFQYNKQRYLETTEDHQERNPIETQFYGIRFVLLYNLLLHATGNQSDGYGVYVSR